MAINLNLDLLNSFKIYLVLLPRATQNQNAYLRRIYGKSAYKKFLEENLRSFTHLKRFLRKQMVAVILSGCGYLDGSEIRICFNPISFRYSKY